MSNEPRKPEQDLERDLGNVQAEWNRMDQAEPPELLDQAVRNAARRDLEPKRKGIPFKWLGGFATATVVVLAVSVLLEQEPGGTPSGQGQPNGLRLEKQAIEAGENTAKERRDQAPLPAAEPRAMAREAKRERQPLRTAADPEQAFSAGKTDVSGPTGHEMDEAAAELAEVMPETMADAAPAPVAKAAAPMAEEEALPAPEDWIEELSRLKSSGRQTEFEAGLQAFQAAYPDYPLPAGLVTERP